VTAPPDDGVPEGWSLALDPSARRAGDGRVLIGGAPTRLLRLTEAGARWLDSVVAGARVPGSAGHRRLARRLVDVGLAHARPPGGDGTACPDVAVVIPVRDMAAGLAATLRSLPEVGEIVVVDDGSADPGALRSASGDATVLRHDRSLGPAAARERGWRATTMPIVAFVDAEVEAASVDWLARLRRFLDDGSLAAVAPRVQASGGEAPGWLAAYDRVRSSLDLGARPAAVRPGSPVAYVPTTALLVRRDALEDVNGFDTRLRVGEDVDLVWRLHRSGWRVRYEPSVEVRHPSRATLAGWVRQRVAYGTSAALLARRHGAAAAPLTLSRWTAATSAAVVLGHPVVGAGIAAGSAAALTPKLDGVEHPWREAARIVASGQASSARHLAEALRRPWWPLAALLGIRVRRLRPLLVAAAVLPNVLEAAAVPSEVGRVRYALLRLADDVAYGAGVWIGCFRDRSVRALLPSLASRRADRVSC
jgi:mycofactocin system glycosyltransferase